MFILASDHSNMGFVKKSHCPFVGIDAVKDNVLNVGIDEHFGAQ